MKKKVQPPSKTPPPPNPQKNGPWRIAAFWIGLLMILGGAAGLWITEGRPSFLPVPDKTPESVDTVILDAGHGGYDNGASGNSLIEKNLCLDVVQRVARLLEKEGVRILMTRDTDRFITLSDRTTIGNKELRAIFVSIHFNQASNQSAAGIETYFFSEAGSGEMSEDERLAGCIQSHLIEVMQVPDRGVKATGYYVLRHSRIPAVLVEGGFVSNVPEAKLLLTPGYREKLARSVAEAILLYRTELLQRTEVALTSKSG